MHYYLGKTKSQTFYYTTSIQNAYGGRPQVYKQNVPISTNLNNILFSCFGGYIKVLSTDVRPVALFGDINIQPPFMQRDILVKTAMFRTNIYYTSGVNGCCSAVGPNNEYSHNFYSDRTNWRTVRFIQLND